MNGYTSMKHFDNIVIIGKWLPLKLIIVRFKFGYFLCTYIRHMYLINLIKIQDISLVVYHRLREKNMLGYVRASLICYQITVLLRKHVTFSRDIVNSYEQCHLSHIFT